MHCCADVVPGELTRVCCRQPRASLQDVDSAAAMLGCAWSPCGTYIAAGSRDCNVHMWRWGISTQASQGPAQQHPGSAAGTASAGVLHAADWPQPEPLPVLRGHSKGVWQVEFNHTGSMLASGSMDGSARVGLGGCWAGPYAAGSACFGLMSSLQPGGSQSAKAEAISTPRGPEWAEQQL